MKKVLALEIFLLVLTVVLVFGIVGCNNQVVTPTVPYPEYTQSAQPSTNTTETHETVNHDMTDPESIPPVTTTPDIIPCGVVFDYSLIPEYSGKAFYMVNNGDPYFSEEERTHLEPVELYSPFDDFGRCGVAIANVCKELMPTESRGDISSVYPSGWKYNGKSNNTNYGNKLVDGGYLYNRCHLIGFQLAGENDNRLNLVTGTRYMNVDGMLPFENMIADYVKETGNHVFYRVTPVYVGAELVCRGVLMEAYSVEDEGDGVCYNVFCYNVQPGVVIDYETGQNWVDEVEDTYTASEVTEKYVLNTNSKKFHQPDCSSVESMNPNNREYYTGTREQLINDGYVPCGSCKP